MKNVIIAISIVILLISPSDLFAQTETAIITGKVTDNTEALMFANVVIMTMDSIFIQGVITNEDGAFHIVNIPLGQYIMKTSFVGYETNFMDIVINSQMHTIENIVLEAGFHSVNEVVITALRPVYTLRRGSVITNVSNSLLSTIGTAYDVLEKIPGLNMQDGKVNVFGKGAPIIYINNRKIHDPQELERLQSSSIKSIELITNPGAKYDAEGKAVLVIKTNKTESDGISLQLTERLKKATYWGDNENINLSYNTKKIHLFASYDHSYQKNKVKEETNYKIDADTLWHQVIQFPYKYSYSTNDITSGIDWSITDNHSIGIQYLGSFSSMPNRINANQQVYANGNLYDNITSLTTIDDNPYQHLVNLFYQTNLNDLFNIQFDFDYLKNHTETDQTSEEQSSITGNRLVEISSESDFNLIAGKLTVNYDIKEKGKLEIGGEYNKINGSGLYFNLDGYIQNNIYTNKEEKSAAFLSYQDTFKKLEFNIGVRYEHAIEFATEDVNKTIKVDNKSNDFYPSISLSQRFEQVQMSLSANRRTKRPSFSQLNDNNVYVNRFITQKGNPYLAKEDIFNVNYHMIYKYINFDLGYTYIKDLIDFSLQSSENSSSESIITYINYPKAQKIDALLSINYPIGIWKPELTAGVIQPFFSTQNNGYKQKYNKTDYSLKFYNDFTLPHEYIFSVNFNYQSDYDSYVTRWGGYKRLDLRLRKSFFKKSLMVNIHVRDVFNWEKEKTIIAVNNFNFDQYKKRETQFVSLSLQYNFNNFKSKYRGNNAATDDINRL